MKTHEFDGKKYLEHHGLICPYCDSKEIRATSHDFGDDYCWRDVVCEDCGREWTETLTLSGAEEVHDYDSFTTSK